MNSTDGYYISGTSRALCSLPTLGTSYASKQCTSIGDTQLLSCGTLYDPPLGSYVLCVPGSYNVLGSDFQVSNCTTKEVGIDQFVFKTCFSGNRTTSGSDAIIKTCSKPSAGQYVKST